MVCRVNHRIGSIPPILRAFRVLGRPTLNAPTRVRFVRSSYRALFGRPTERERTTYGSGAWDAPSSEFNRARGDDDSWGGTQASLGLSLTEHWFRS